MVASMDRRLCARVPVYLELTYQKEKEAAHSHRGIAHDISRGGLGLRQYGSLHVGHRIYVALTLPHQGRIHLRGIVVWCAEKEGNVPSLHHAGLRWAKVDRAAQTRLDAFLNEQIESAKKPQGPFMSPAADALQSQMERSEQWMAVAWGCLLAVLLAFMGVLFWLSLR